MKKKKALTIWLYECKYGAKGIYLEKPLGASCDTITAGEFHPLKQRRKK